MPVPFPIFCISIVVCLTPIRFVCTWLIEIIVLNLFEPASSAAPYPRGPLIHSLIPARQHLLARQIDCLRFAPQMPGKSIICEHLGAWHTSEID